MKFVSYNIQYGIGQDGRFDPERIARAVDGADVIALQEVTRGFVRNGHADLVETFSSLFPAYFASFGAASDVLVDHAMVEGRLRERRFQFGNMVLSRFPVLAARNLLLPRARTFDKLNLQRGAQEAVIDAPGGALRVYSVHLDHVSPDERMAQIAYLKARANGFVDEGGALTGASEFAVPDPALPADYLLMGDFNEWRLGPGSALTRLEPIFGPLPPPIPSFPARLPVLSLDRIMANRTDLISDMTVHDTPLARLASDHLPLTARVRLHRVED